MLITLDRVKDNEYAVRSAMCRSRACQPNQANNKREEKKEEKSRNQNEIIPKIWHTIPDHYKEINHNPITNGEHIFQLAEKHSQRI